MTLEEALEERIASAARGREYWLRLEKSMEMDDGTWVVLFPQAGTACNRYTVKHLSRFAKNVGAKRLILLANDPWVLESGDVGEIPCERVSCGWAEAEELVAYYAMQMFTDKLIIASLDEPAGRNGKNMVGVRGATEEEVVAVGILGLEKC